MPYDVAAQLLDDLSGARGNRLLESGWEVVLLPMKPNCAAL